MPPLQLQVRRTGRSKILQSLLCFFLGSEEGKRLTLLSLRMYRRMASRQREIAMKGGPARMATLTVKERQEPTRKATRARLEEEA